MTNTQLLLLLCLLPLFFLNLGSVGLLYNNEGLYAQIPLEMLTRGDFIIPHLNGVPYIEKPPLLYWFIALSYKLFGVSEWSARLAPALAGFGLVALTSRFAQRQLTPRQAFLVTLVLGTSVGLCVLSRTILFDVVFSLFLAAGLFAFYEKRLRWAYVWLALAVMTKGFVAVALGGLFVLAYLAATRASWKEWLAIFDPAGLLLFFIIISPWHLLASFQEPGFAWFYFVNEHVLRFLGLRTPKDYYQGPIYYYTYRLLLLALPWSLFTWTFFIRTTKSNLKIFLWLWLSVFFIFFSLSQAKANYYLITALTPFMILLTLQLEETWERMRPYVRGIALGFAFIPYGIIYPFVWRYRAKIEMTFVLIALQTATLTIAVSFICPKFEGDVSPKQIIVPYANRNHEACLYRDYEKISPVLFYLQSTIPIVDSVSHDLHYGQHTGKRPDLFITAEEMPQKCKIVFVHRERWEHFRKTFPAYQLRGWLHKVFVFEK